LFCNSSSCFSRSVSFDGAALVRPEMMKPMTMPMARQPIALNQTILKSLLGEVGGADRDWPLSAGKRKYSRNRGPWGQEGAEIGWAFPGSPTGIWRRMPPFFKVQAPPADDDHFTDPSAAL